MRQVILSLTLLLLLPKLLESAPIQSVWNTVQIPEHLPLTPLPISPDETALLILDREKGVCNKETEIPDQQSTHHLSLNREGRKRLIIFHSPTNNKECIWYYATSLKR